MFQTLIRKEGANDEVASEEDDAVEDLFQRMR